MSVGGASDISPVIAGLGWTGLRWAGLDWMGLSWAALGFAVTGAGKRKGNTDK